MAGTDFARQARGDHLPLLASYLWIGQLPDFTSAAVQYVEQTFRPLMPIALLLFCSMQISIVLHNNRFGKQLRTCGVHAPNIVTGCPLFSG